MTTGSRICTTISISYAAGYHVVCCNRIISKINGDNKNPSLHQYIYILSPATIFVFGCCFSNIYYLNINNNWHYNFLKWHTIIKMSRCYVFIISTVLVCVHYPTNIFAHISVTRIIYISSALLLQRTYYKYFALFGYTQPHVIAKP